MSTKCGPIPCVCLGEGRAACRLPTPACTYWHAIWSARLAYFPLHSQGPDFWCVEIFTCRGNIAWDVVGGRGLSCLACVYFLWDLGNLLLRGSQVCFLGFFCTYPQWHIHKTYLMVWRVTSSAKPFISANSTSSVLWSTSMTICLLNLFIYSLDNN